MSEPRQSGSKCFLNTDKGSDIHVGLQDRFLGADFRSEDNLN